MKKTALTNKHIELGAKMVSFAGYEMPVRYKGIKEEHQTVRNGVGVFDVSHMGEFILSGKNALNLIQYISSNDASKLFDGKAQYTCFPNGKGGIVDDFLVYRIQEEKYFLVVNASNIEKDWNWIKQHNRWNVEMENVSDDYSLLAVQGPKAAEALQDLTDINLSEMGYYTFQIGEFANCRDVIVSATGYTGSGGFEIYIKNESAEKVWDAIFEAGKKVNIAPIGLGARDTLRLEMGFCLYGNDITDETSPLEAGLGWITKLKKESDFIDKSFLTKQKADGLSRKLIAFEMIEKGIPRQGYEIQDDKGKKIGIVTSGSDSPSTGKFIGLGYVKTDFTAKDTEIFIAIRNKKLKAKIVKLPFYKTH